MSLRDGLLALHAERGGRLRATTPERDLAWSLVLEHLLFAAQAEARWLDHVEAALMSEGRS